MKKIFLIIFIILLGFRLQAQVIPISYPACGSAYAYSPTGPYNLTPWPTWGTITSAGAIWFTSSYNVDFTKYFDIQFDANFDPIDTAEKWADGIVAVFGSNVISTSVNHKGGCLGYYNYNFLYPNHAFDKSLGVEFDIFNNSPLWSDIPEDHTAVCINADATPVSGGGPVAINGTVGVHDGLTHHYEMEWCPDLGLLKVFAMGNLLLSTPITPGTIFSPPSSVPWGFTGATEIYYSNLTVSNVVINTLPKFDVENCLVCSPNFWWISDNSSIDPTPPSHVYSAGGLFIDAGILINGPATSISGVFKNPDPNTLLMASSITVLAPTVGNSFQAVPHNSTFFELLPKAGCVSPCSVLGDHCLTMTGPLGRITLIGSPVGGSWLSDNPLLFTVSTSGDVEATTSTLPGATATIYYTTEQGCIVSWHVSLCGTSDTRAKGQNMAGNLLVNEGDIKVYPNPTQNNITISYPCKTAGVLEIAISDVEGRKKYLEQVTCNEGNNVQHVVDLSTFAPGVYFVDLTMNDQHVMKKVVKM